MLGLRLRTAVLVGTLLVVGAGATAWFSPLVSVREVTVQGAAVLPPEQVVVALGVPQGTPLLQVDLGEAARRVAAVPRVESAEVERLVPSGLRVSLVERTAVVFLDAPDGQHLVDGSGVDFATEAPAAGLPRLVVDTPGPDDPETAAALRVLTALPDVLRVQVAQVGAASTSDVELTLVDGRVVRWGDAEDSARKAAVVTALLTRPGRTFDVSSPDLPTTS